MRLLSVFTSTSLVHKLFQEYHYEKEGAHFGPDKTYRTIRGLYWAPDLCQIIKEKCSECQKCCLYKAAQVTFNEPQIKGIAAHPLEKLELDVQGPFLISSNGNKYIIVATDSLTKHVFAKATKNQEAGEVTNKGTSRSETLRQVKFGHNV